MEEALTSGKQAKLRLQFMDGNVVVSGLCNTLRAGYRVDGAKMTIEQVVGTLKMCSDAALMKFEQDVAARLKTVTSFGIVGVNRQDFNQKPVLTLKFAGADEWRLDGKPTNETKYGSAGETIFLEVEPTLQACHHPLIPNKQCMRVRTIKYDAQGLKQAQGDWQLFYDEIEGFEHQAGIRNILRVKRYARANVPADASRYVYVLDMIVQSGRESSAR